MDKLAFDKNPEGFKEISHRDFLGEQHCRQRKQHLGMELIKQAKTSFRGLNVYLDIKP